ncbi:MAG: hypothetical protein Q7Q73_00630 [Verrucomicrobiota bacterium JB024]|nr:hypothetical protein [Verrucomicrobiota bacterium JB024]
MGVIRKLFCSLAVVSVLAGVAYGDIAIANYSYNVAPSGSYPDSGGVELTDGTDLTAAWGAGISHPNSTPLVGWRYIDGSITFNFTQVETVGSFTVWAADSDGYAGVGVPATITLSTAGETFTQTFTVTNPAGNGTTVPLTFEGFSVTTDQLTVSFVRGYEWTMYSEVTFSSVPEPAHVGAALGTGVLAVLVWMRRRRRA